MALDPALIIYPDILLANLFLSVLSNFLFLGAQKGHRVKFIDP